MARLPPERNGLDGEAAGDARPPLLAHAARLHPGCPRTDTGALEHDDVVAALQQLPRDREPRDSTAHDGAPKRSGHLPIMRQAARQGCETRTETLPLAPPYPSTAIR